MLVFLEGESWWDVNLFWTIPLISAMISGLFVSLTSFFIQRGVIKRQEKKDIEREETLKKKEEKRKNEENTIRNEVKKYVDSSVTAQLTPIKKDINAIKLGSQANLRDSIVRLVYKCTEKGFRSEYDTKNCDDMFKAYTQLGGNSFIHEIVKKFHDLPTEIEYKTKKNKKKKSYKKKGE